MNRLINAELTKFKKSKIKYSCLVILLPVILMTLIYAINPKYPIIKWDTYLTEIQTFLNMIVCIAVFGIITAYMFGSEFETKTINILFTYPFNRSKILISKLTAIFILIFSSLMITFAASLLCGLLLKHEPLTANVVLSHFTDYLKISVMQFMLITLVSALTIHFKNILPAVILVVAVTFLNFIIMNTTINVFYPWSIPLIVTPNSTGSRTNINYIAAYSTLMISFVVGSFFSFKKFKYIN